MEIIYNTNNSNNTNNTNNTNKRKFDIEYDYEKKLTNNNYKIYNFYKNDSTNCNIILCDNHIYFNSLINNETINILKLNIHSLIANKHLINNNSTLYLHINSKGGNVLNLLEFINFKSTIALEIISIVENFVSDCAILLAATCNYRIINKNAKTMLTSYHDLQNLKNYWGFLKQCENNQFEVECLKNSIYNLFCNVIDSKITQEKLQTYLMQNSYWDAKKYKKLGLADEIV